MPQQVVINALSRPDKTAVTIVRSVRIGNCKRSTPLGTTLFSTF